MPTVRINSSHLETILRQNTAKRKTRDNSASSRTKQTRGEIASTLDNPMVTTQQKRWDKWYWDHTTETDLAAAYPTAGGRYLQPKHTPKRSTQPNNFPKKRIAKLIGVRSLLKKQSVQPARILRKTSDNHTKP